MVTRLYEWDKNETWWNAIEVTSNKVINLLLRSEDNLLQVEDNELFCDLQLADDTTTSDNLPVWITVGRVSSWDGRVATWTMIAAVTTSWDQITIIYGDDNKLYVDNWTWTFKQIYNKTEVDGLFTALRWELANVATSWSYTDLINTPGVCTMTIGSLDANYIWTVTQVNWLVDGAVVIWSCSGLVGLQGLEIAWDSVTVENWIATTDNWTHFYGIYKTWTWVIIFSYNNN